jgi:hypothetical protein
MKVRGFTLFETVLVIAMLALASVALMKLQRDVFRTQSYGRDETVGNDLMRSCAERLLAVRRQIAYGQVTTGLCSTLGGVGGFGNPTVTMVDAAATSIGNCSSATCTITIKVARTSGPAALLSPITLQLSAY